MSVLRLVCCGAFLAAACADDALRPVDVDALAVRESGALRGLRADNESAPAAPTSTGQLHTFYVYRAQSYAEYPLANHNAANLIGAVWYLQNEIVSGKWGPGVRFNVTRILRFKIQMRATQALLDRGMNFGVRVAFDSGKCTGPACDYMWSTFGYNIGCNKFESRYPWPNFQTHYRGGVWYSFPGACPSRYWSEVDAECESQEAGGMCDGVPTGNSTCTWNYEPAGEVRLEELYENSSSSDFWAQPEDEAANEQKVNSVQALFEDKYGADPEAPPCDFRHHKFYA